MCVTFDNGITNVKEAAQSGGEKIKLPLGNVTTGSIENRMFGVCVCVFVFQAYSLFYFLLTDDRHERNSNTHRTVSV